MGEDVATVTARQVGDSWQWRSRYRSTVTATRAEVRKSTSLRGRALALGRQQSSTYERALLRGVSGSEAAGSVTESPFRALSKNATTITSNNPGRDIAIVDDLQAPLPPPAIDDGDPGQPAVAVDAALQAIPNWGMARRRRGPPRSPPSYSRRHP
jgi:hypothetical protein